MKLEPHKSGSISRTQVIKKISDRLKFQQNDVEQVLNALDEVIINEILTKGIYDCHGIFYIYTSKPKTTEKLKKYNISTRSFSYV